MDIFFKVQQIWMNFCKKLFRFYLFIGLCEKTLSSSPTDSSNVNAKPTVDIPLPFKNKQTTSSSATFFQNGKCISST